MCEEQTSVTSLNAVFMLDEWLSNGGMRTTKGDIVVLHGVCEIKKKKERKKTNNNYSSSIYPMLQ